MKEMPKAQNVFKAENFDASKPYVFAGNGKTKVTEEESIITNLIVANIPDNLQFTDRADLNKVVYGHMTRKLQEYITQVGKIEGKTFQTSADSFQAHYVDFINSVRPETIVRASKTLTAEGMAIEDIAKAIMFHKKADKIADARKRAVEFHKAGNTVIWQKALKEATKKFNAMQAVPEGEEY